MTLAAMRRGAEIVFKVSAIADAAFAPEMIDRVFERFESLFQRLTTSRPWPRTLDRESYWFELHGGRVTDRFTAPNEGTTVTCIFPIDPVRGLVAESLQLAAQPEDGKPKRVRRYERSRRS